MKKESYKIYIVGAGISGLTAARVLEENGYCPIVLEAEDHAGGRIKTEIIDGYQLDKGFQVLLTAYPAVRKYLDLDALDLQKLKPGAVLFKKGGQRVLGDPSRDISLLWPTLTSSVGTISDKIRVLLLKVGLKRKSPLEIFESEDRSTLSFLTDFGFTPQMVHDFFSPFFSGIFLEPELDTSSRMFKFIYKMFGEGYAAIPKSGIGAIAEQLYHTLSKTTFRFNTKVRAITDGGIRLTNGETLGSDYTIVATGAGNLIDNFKGRPTKWKSCDTLYFETSNRVINKPLIGLIPGSGTLINNIFFHTSLPMTHRQEKELLSVTIIKGHDLSDRELILRVQRELTEHCGIGSYRFLKHYHIPMALPDLKDVRYQLAPSETLWTSRVFLAGDIHLNGSLNAAMLSGESAAIGVLNGINGSSAR